MYQATGVELDLEINGSCVNIRLHHPATLLILGITLDIHDTIESWVNAKVNLYTISQAVDQHLWAREVCSPEGYLF